MVELAVHPGGVASPQLDGAARVAAEAWVRLPELQQHMQLEPEHPALFNSLGQELPSAADQIMSRELWANTSSLLGEIAARSAVSSNTGCWSILKGRDAKGYVRIYGKKFSEFLGETNNRYGIKAHRLAYILFRNEIGFEEKLSSADQIDHVCRNPACCNPRHLAKVSNEQNDSNKREAHRVENLIALGQLVLGRTYIDWLDKTVAGLGENQVATMATRFGPREVFKIDDEPAQFSVRKMEDDLFDSLRPTPRPSARKSRARKPAVIDGQLQMAA